jgi:hypothetical protein
MVAAFLEGELDVRHGQFVFGIDYGFVIEAKVVNHKRNDRVFLLLCQPA